MQTRFLVQTTFSPYITDHSSCTRFSQKAQVFLGDTLKLPTSSQVHISKGFDLTNNRVNQVATELNDRTNQVSVEFNDRANQVATELNDSVNQTAVEFIDRANQVATEPNDRAHPKRMNEIDRERERYS